MKTADEMFDKRKKLKAKFNDHNFDRKSIIALMVEFAEYKVGELLDKARDFSPTEPTEGTKLYSEKNKFNIFPNHGDEDGRKSWTVIFGQVDDIDHQIVGCADTEEEAKYSAQKLNEIFSPFLIHKDKGERDEQIVLDALRFISRNLNWMKVNAQPKEGNRSDGFNLRLEAMEGFLAKALNQFTIKPNTEQP